MCTITVFCAVCTVVCWAGAGLSCRAGRPRSPPLVGRAAVAKCNSDPFKHHNPASTVPPLQGPQETAADWGQEAVDRRAGGVGVVLTLR